MHNDVPCGNIGQGLSAEGSARMDGSRKTGRGRVSSSKVANANWNPRNRQVNVNWNDSDNSNPKLGARPAIVVLVLIASWEDYECI